MEDQMDSGHVVRLRGLPWNATPKDIVEFFSDCNVDGQECGVHLTLTRDNRPSGEAYIKMMSPDDVERAKEKHNKHMGKRYIEVFSATSSEMDWVVKRSGHNCNDGDAIVRLRGLPYECTKEEVAHFFAGLQIAPKGITFVKKFDARYPRDPKGCNTGSAFVQFASPDIAEKALKKDRAYMGQRYVEVFKSCMSEMKQATQQQRMHAMRPPMSRPGPYDRVDPRGMGNMGMMGPMARGRGRMNMKPFREFNDNGYGDYDDYGYDDYGPGDGFGSGGMGNRRGGGYGGGGGGMGGGGGGMGMGRSNFGGGNQGRMGGMSTLGGGANSNVNRGQPGWQYQSCTGHHVHMRGLPYQANEQDIMEFFKGIELFHVEIHYKPNKQATGEADAEFVCHEDAKLAFERDRQIMKNRYIELFLHSAPGNPYHSGGGGGGGSNMDGCGMGGGNRFSSALGGGGGGGSYRNNSGMGNFFSSGMSGGSGMGGMSGSGMGSGFGGGGSSMGMGNNYTAF